ncbi:Lysine histidine transporter-like 1 [Platanthera guangdongensis]|uniref:Lysine histidine transporter-like 1 n=1 Tax=Platanthera guangdongensis TaxID=2320717 RepID=A0ABR2N1P0_9ASPA
MLAMTIIQRGFCRLMRMLSSTVLLKCPIANDCYRNVAEGNDDVDDDEALPHWLFLRGPRVAILILSWIITLYTLWQMVEMHEIVSGKRFDRYHELGASQPWQEWTRILSRWGELEGIQFAVLILLGKSDDGTPLVAKVLRTGPENEPISSKVQDSIGWTGRTGVEL